MATKKMGGELDLEALVTAVQAADEPTLAKLRQALGTADAMSTVQLIRTDRQAAKIAQGIIGKVPPARTGATVEEELAAAATKPLFPKRPIGAGRGKLEI